MDIARRLSPPGWSLQAPVTRVLDALAAGGAEARFAGGCVRDTLAGRSVRDIDLATPASPGIVIRLLEAAGIKAVPTGLSHGTVTAVSSHLPVEITTLRQDVATDGRHATVAFTDDWAADAARRDFTFNAMFMDRSGGIYDAFDGAADLAAGRVRFVGEAEARIREDYLRILRFFRFLAWYGRTLPDSAALEACAGHASALVRLSAERLRMEILKLLGAPNPMPGLDPMAETGVYGAVLGFAFDLPARAALARLIALESEHGIADPLRRLGLLLRSAVAGEEQGRGGSQAPGRKGTLPADRLANRLRLANRERAGLRSILEIAVPLPADGDDVALSRTLYRYGAACVREAGLVAWALSSRDAADADVLITRCRAWVPRKLPLTGADIEGLGIPRGPQVGALLKAAEDYWLDAGMTPDRAALLAFVRSQAPS